MNKTDFLRDPSVGDFVSWLARTLPTLPVDLKLKRSRFVPATVNRKIVGLDAVLSSYVWQSVGMPNGDWSETRHRLLTLANALKAAVGANDDVAALNACREILAWGGNRDWAKGAFPFLQARANAGSLCRYLRDTRQAFALATADTDRLCPPVELLNSMLTKVHALCSSDGLPIYDSRVAAAIASLVEMSRNQAGKAGTPLPAALAFPATTQTRTVRHAFPDAVAPGVMLYGASATCPQWASAKVRLGWLIQAVLEQCPGMFSACSATPTLGDRMHAFEASLFMIGYDVACLSRASPPSNQ